LTSVAEGHVQTRVDGVVCDRCAIAPDPLEWLRTRLPALAFAMLFSAAEVRPGGVVALPNRFVRDRAAQRHGDELRLFATSTGSGCIELVVDPTVSAPTADEQPPDPPREAPSIPVREQPPGLTTRLS
jgi:hypothetical protein